MIAALLPIIAACMPITPEEVNRDEIIVLRNGTVIDGTGRGPYRADIVIAEGLIIAIDEHYTGPADNVLDLSEHYIIPGLIDSHVHLSGPLEPSVGPAGPEDLQSFLSAGVTTVRDMGATLDAIVPLAIATRTGAIAGPEIIYVGMTLNGRAEADFHRPVTTPYEARAAIDDMAAAGAIQIKIHNSLDPDLIPIMAEYAASLGLDLVGHIGPDAGPLAACEQGMNEISHATALMESVLWRRVPPAGGLLGAINELRGEGSDPLYACMSSRGMIFAPNLSLYPPMIASVSGEQAEMTRNLLTAFGEITRRAHQQDVTLIVATDANGADVRPAFGGGVHLELALLVEAGLSEMEALQAATLNPARHLGAADSIGSILPGLEADLVVLCENPLDDITHSESILLVLANGYVVHEGGC